MATPPAPVAPIHRVLRPATMAEVHWHYLHHLDEQMQKLRNLDPLNKKAICELLEELSWTAKLYQIMISQDYYQKFCKVVDKSSSSKQERELLKKEAQKRAQMFTAQLSWQVQNTPELLALAVLQPQDMVSRFFAEERDSHRVWFNGQWDCFVNEEDQKELITSPSLHKKEVDPFAK